VGGVIEDLNKLFYNTPENLSNLGVQTFMKHDVQHVDFEKKEILVKNLETEETFLDHYPKLIITVGSWPITPSLEGIHLSNILLSKNFHHSKKITRRAQDAQKIVVVGAGYIGVELVEAFRNYGKMLP
jgi:NADPH-dependent 2,4-dienoyl-CoA reductase/sulfur reductase-like enzyme